MLIGKNTLVISDQISLDYLNHVVFSELPDHDQLEGGDKDLKGDQPHPAVVGAPGGGQLDHLLHQQLVVEHNLEKRS